MLGNFLEKQILYHFKEILLYECFNQMCVHEWSNALLL